ncbi:ATP-binding protein, partial [uncultured Prochlorococcus sp.]|uniref:ATP-binding protein n=1 Tax=uncultured Prochlorococcus sp. TaxID=159733 RepID=UPI0025883E10
MEEVEINISPEMGIYKVFKYLNYTTWFALAEFIDNSLQSFITKKKKTQFNRDKCIINIQYFQKENKLIISDNAFGITESEHQRAFTAGIPPQDSSGLSEFGIGMKSAAIWYSPRWSVTTQPYDSNLEYKYEFNLTNIVKGDGKILPEIKEISTKKGFTRIELNNLHHKLNEKNLKVIMLNLASIYRIFMRKEILELTINNEKVRYQEIEILNDYPENINTNIEKKLSWKQDIDLVINKEIKVRGFIALRKKDSIENSGLSLFRRNRLIIGNHNNLYRPKTIFGRPNSIQYSRIFGELHLEGIEVSHTKDSFNFGSIEDDFIKKIYEKINQGPYSLYKQACLYKAKEFDENTLLPTLNIIDNIILKLNNNIQDVLNDISLKKRFGIINKMEINSIQKNKNYLEYKFSKNILKLLINKLYVETKVCIGEIKKDKFFEVFIDNKKNSKLKNFFIVINKNHQFFINASYERDESIEIFISLTISL